VKLVVGVLAALVLVSCSGGNSSGDSGRSESSAAATGSALFVADVRLAAEAVEAELGGPQDFFEITATPQLTNIFVATDDGNSAVPYVYVDGELQSPAPTIEGVDGQTFTLDAVDFDEATVLTGVANDVPTATIDAFSVEGGAGGFARYVISARSAQGGVLDIVVAPSGAVVEVILL
jgi:hypothetical protein